MCSTTPLRVEPDRRERHLPHDSEWAALLADGTAALATARHRRAEAETGFEALWQHMQAASPWVMACTLQRLGAFPEAGATTAATPEFIAARCGIADRLRPLLAPWLSVMTEAGLLQAEPGPRYRPASSWRPEAIESRAVELLGRLASFDADPAWRPFTDYFLDHAKQQPSLLTGTTDPLALLFPDGDSRVVDVLYQHNPVSQALNDAAAAVMRHIADHAPQDQTLSVLELGAGTGATTAAVLPALPAQRRRYTFTDVSRFFLTRARKRFATEAGLDYALLNVDHDPLAQGQAAQSVDVMVAANVLHDAADIERSLRQLLPLLKPGGLLLLIEGSQNTAVQLVTVALLESFGTRHDPHRPDGLPLMAPDQWRRCALAAGFARCDALAPDLVPTALPQHLMLLQAPKNPQRLPAGVPGESSRP